MRRVIRVIVVSSQLIILTALSAFSNFIPDDGRKQIRALKVENGGLKFDGHLDDSIWQVAPFVADFLQKEPTEGGHPVDSTRVAIAYDDEAIYIGAQMFSKEPDALRRHLDKHDVQGPAEQMIVCLDTYLDRRTAYVFGVNTAGVRFDRYHYEDSEGIRDFSYNPVWEAKTNVDDEGWTAEMRIPFSQLRFNKDSELVWGVNFNRWIPSRNEDVFWIYTPRDETGYASRFGNLVGIENVKPSRRIELLPYAASDDRIYDNPNPGNPFADGNDFEYRFGTDLKMGLGPNLTLDATFNPDFGQVEADPAEVNLSAYETFYSEKRPFFIEGSHLFSARGPTYFYSRRIGASPHGSATGDFVDSPNNTTILGASKITGRLNSGLSIGVIGAVTEREYAKGFDTTSGVRSDIEIEPTTMWGVTRLQQELGEERSTVGIILTGMDRDLNDTDPISSDLHKQALTGGADWDFRFNKGMYRLRGYTGFSHVSGTENSILQTQFSSAHYFQRPDQDHVTIDSSRTSMTGITNSIEFFKNTGKHWLWGVGYGMESPDFELNDAGILNSADDISAWSWLAFRNTTPGKIFRNYYFELDGNTGWNYDGVRTGGNLELYGEVTWHNYMNTWLGYSRQLGWQSDDRTRGGPLMWFEKGWNIFGGMSTNYGANTRFNFNGNYARDEFDGWLYGISASLYARVGTRWEFTISPSYRREEQPRQYVSLSDQSGGPAATYGRRYSFARLDASTLRLQFRMNYYFSPDLSLEVYAEPFSAAGHYFDHGELMAASTSDIKLYGTEGTTITHLNDGKYEITDGAQTFQITSTDYGVRSFRSNVVLRWEFNPGSTLYLVWQRNLSEDRDEGRMVKFGSLFDTFGANGTDFLALKIAYWIPVS
jgi:hypothetical protein